MQGGWTGSLPTSFFSRTKGIEFLQQQGIDPEETEEGELSQGFRNREKDKEELFLHFLGSVCKLETVMNAVKCQLADMNGLSTE